jgi:hypothetical protein
MEQCIKFTGHHLFYTVLDQATRTLKLHKDLK